MGPTRRAKCCGSFWKAPRSSAFRLALANADRLRDAFVHWAQGQAALGFFLAVLVCAAARAYLVEESSRNPLASPLYGDLRGLPPLLLHASTSELLRDDSVRLATRAVEAGVEARVALWPDAPHCWQLAALLTPQARESIEQAAGFLRERAGGPLAA